MKLQRRKREDGNFRSGNAAVRSVQRESTVVFGFNRRLQLPHRLWLERPLRPLTSRTPLQVLISLLPSLAFCFLFNDLIVVSQSGFDRRRSPLVTSRYTPPRRTSICHETARPLRSGLLHRACLQIRASHYV